MAKKNWKVYRKNLTYNQAGKIIAKLVKNGKVWGETVTSTNIFDKYTVHIR